jgi:hypothetical protein
VPETTVTERAETEADVKPPKPPAVQDDRQRFIVTPVCPKCSGKLVPERGTYCQNCGAKLPDELAVHREVVVAIRPEAYKALAVHLKQEMNAAWSQLAKGRRVEKVSRAEKDPGMSQNIFLLTISDEVRTSSAVQEKRLDELLEETGIGRLSTDPWEIREIHKILTLKQQESTQ